MKNNSFFLSKNPEFQRQLWIELNPLRLIVMPLVLGLVFFIFADKATETTAFNSLGNVALVFYILIAIGWGNKSASEGLLEEHNEKTWDQQKMSALHPVEMLWGKLFGSTIYQWYGSLMCLVVYIFYHAQWGKLSQALVISAMAAIFTVFGHAIVMMGSLVEMRKHSERAKIKSGTSFLLRFGLAIPVLAFGFNVQELFNSTAVYSWYGISCSLLTLTFGFLCFYTFWALIGLYRTFRQEMQFESGIWGWFVFLLSTWLINGGLLSQNPEWDTYEKWLLMVLLGFISLILILYYLALNEPKDVVLFRSLWKLYQSKDYPSLLKQSPLWLLTLPLVIFFGIVSLANVWFYDPLVSQETMGELGTWGKAKSLALLISIFGFILRDLFLLLWIHSNTSSKRADFASWVYLILVYFLVPYAIGGKEVGFFFFPDPSSSSLLLVLLPLAEASFAFYVLQRSWKSLALKASSVNN